MSHTPDPLPEQTQQPPHKKFSCARLLPLIVIVAALIVGWVFFRDALSIDTLRENREALTSWRDSNYFLAAMIYVGVYAGVVALSLPFALPMTLTGGFLFGLVAGTLLTVTGATLGASGIFLAAKTGLADALRARAGPWMRSFEEGIRKNEISYLFLLRLVPAIPFFAANLLPAFFGIKLRTFVWTTFFGIMPGTAAFTFAGAGIGDVFDRGEAFSFSLFADPMIYGPLGALIVLAMVPIALKAVRKK